jgi:hypothetical protein
VYQFSPDPVRDSAFVPGALCWWQEAEAILVGEPGNQAF